MLFAQMVFGENELGYALIYYDFYPMVNHCAPWDIKREIPWEETIGTTFPGHGAKVLFSGMIMTPEKLANYTYGFLGYTYGIPLEVLIPGSYYAVGFPTSGAALSNEVYDWFFISLGYHSAEQLGGS